MKKKLKKNKKYIIVEILPTAISPTKGPIAQISALKIEGLKLLNRFDYRLKEGLIDNLDIKKMISYDKEQFIYVGSNERMIKDFTQWCENIDLLIIDNEYTNNYLKELKNKKESIFQYLNLKMSDDVIDQLMLKYHLQPSSHIVDLLYEALIYESNHK